MKLGQGKKISSRIKANVKTGRGKQRASLRHYEFSKANLALVTLIVAGIGGYVLLTSSAAGLSKVWDTDTDFNAGTLSSTTVSGTGSAAKLQLATQGGGALTITVPTSANLWIDSSGGSCARQSSAGAYSDSGACSSIQTALAACTPGDVIVMKAGTYGSQSISASLTSPGCTVTAENGTTSGPLSTGGSFYTIQNLTVDAGSGHGPGGWGNSGSNITLNNLYVHGAYASVLWNGGSNITWHGGELGQAGVTGGKRTCGLDTEPMETYATNMTIDGVTFHKQDYDATANACSSNGYHLEMIRVDDGTNGLLLKNSMFENGDHADTASIFITNVLGANRSDAPKNLTFQNNFFGSADNSSFGIHSNVSDCSTFTFAYNTFNNSTGSTSSCTNTTGLRYIGNLGPFPTYIGCVGTHTKNVWQDDHTMTCGSDIFVNGTRFATDQLGLGGSDGFHLVAGSPAIDKGEAGGYCTSTLGASDYDGGTRPAGAACDAGADEFGATGGGGGTTYASSGTDILSFDGGAGKTLDWTTLATGGTTTTPTGTSITLDACSTNDGSACTNWSSISSLANSRYIRVRATLATSNSAATPSLDSISLGYNDVTPVDTTPPTVSLTAPAAGNVSGTVSVSANAADDVAVSSVQFKLDGANLGSADASSPYSYSWDSTTASNGTHTLTALATDSSGNATTSSSVTVTVNNGAGGGSTANLWMSTTAGGSCTRSATAVAFNQSTSCAAASTAFTACVAGDTIGVNAGSYGAQTVSGAKASPGCKFDLGLSGSSATFASFTPAASTQWVELKNGNINTYGWQYTSGSVPQNITFRNISNTSNNFIEGVNGLNIIGGSIHDFNANTSACSEPLYLVGTAATPVTNVLIQGVDFYNITTTGTACAIFAPVTLHLELIRVDSYVSNVNIKQNKFHNSGEDTSTVFITDQTTGSGASDPHDVTIENNFFGKAASSFYAITVHANIPSCTNIKIRYNSFGTIVLPGANVSGMGCTSGSGSQLKGNVGPIDDQCPNAGLVASYNVWQYASARSCGSNDKSVTGTNYSTSALGFTNAASGDMHLTASSAAINSGDPADYPSIDFDGNTRFVSSGPDAGADEYGATSGGGAVPGDANSDGHVNITDLSILLSHYATTYAACDFNNDGTVNVTDLSILLSHYGT